MSLKSVGIQSPPLLKPEAFSYQPQAVGGTLSSVRPSPIGLQGRERRPPALPLPRPAAPGLLPIGSIWRKDSPLPRDTLRREKDISRAARDREGGMEGHGPFVPHDRMQGGGKGSALGFSEGKLLYPPVLTPRNTAKLREGKMLRENHIGAPPPAPGPEPIRAERGWFPLWAAAYTLPRPQPADRKAE